jgi:hypothetical protein
MDTDPKHEAAISALDKATSANEIVAALNLIGHKPRSLSFCELMADQAAADRTAQAGAGVKAHELLGRFAQRNPHVVYAAERVNMTSHSKFIAAVLRVMQA